MTGIDLFKALGGAKEEYIAEADGSRKLPHVRKVTLQWCAALAACVCLLLGWGFIAQHLNGIADYTGDETKVTGAAETAQADGADQGTAPAIGGKVVLPVRITAETQPVSDVKVFTDEEKIGQIMPLPKERGGNERRPERIRRFGQHFHAGIRKRRNEYDHGLRQSVL